MWDGSLRSRLHEDAPKSTNRCGTLPRFQRTAEVIIDNPQNPLYNKTSNQLLKDLQRQFEERPVLRDNVDVVRIRSGDKVYEFNVKRSKAGEFLFINAPSVPKPKKVSEVEQLNPNLLASETQTQSDNPVAIQQSLPERQAQNQPEIG
jgi:ribosome-interacting GTPase 1